MLRSLAMFIQYIRLSETVSHDLLRIAIHFVEHKMSPTLMIKI